MNDKKAEALQRATTGESLANFPAIFAGFLEKGIPPEDIKPRENVFTFNAWKAQGRVVSKGQHGVRVVTFIETEKDGEKTRRPWTTTVFHITQTEPLN